MKQTHRYREQTDDCQKGGASRDWVKKVTGLRTTNGELRNSPRDVQYSIDSIVNNTVWCQGGS